MNEAGARGMGEANSSGHLRNTGPAKAAYARKIREARARDEPAVRAAHERGLVCNAIMRETGFSIGYIRVLLAGMKLTPHEARTGRKLKDPRAPRPATCEEAPGEACQARASRDAQRARSASVAHFRDLVAAYPGRKLKSLAIPNGHELRISRADAAPAFSSPAALCADFGASRIWR